MAALAITEITTEALAGTGHFDVLMRAITAHLDAEFAKNRFKGPEYATVYLGSMELAMRTALEFTLQQRKNDAEYRLLEKQILNAVKEGEVLEAQKCKLQAEFDLTVGTTAKTAEELALLTQKTATERAQILATGVDADSVVGRQKGLYVAQTNGFARDAEQKAAKLLSDTWSVRRTTDEGTIAGEVSPGVDNGLGDADIGRAIEKMLEGINA